MKCSLSNELMKILACPKCKNSLRLDEEKCKLFCSKCDKEYPMKGGIPVLMPSNS